MKVAEKTISIWTVVQLHKDTIFKNPSFSGPSCMIRITSIKNYDTWNLRFWKEFFFQYREPVLREEDGYEPEATKQIDEAIKDETE